MTSLFSRVRISRLSSLAVLSSLTLAGAPAPFVPSFDPAVLNYLVTMRTSDVSYVDVQTIASTNAVTSWSVGPVLPSVYTNSVPRIALPVGDTTLALTVISQDSLVRTVYSIKFHSQSNDSTLSYLGLSIGATSPDFSPTTLFSNVTVPFVSTTTTLQVTPTAQSGISYALRALDIYTASYASFNMSGRSGVSSSMLLVEGDNSIVVKVVAEDGLASHTTYYTVIVHRLSSTSSLSALTVNVTAASISPIFAASVLDYSIIAPSSQETVLATVIPSSGTAQMTFSWQGSVPLSFSYPLTLPCDSGDNLLIIVVLSEDGLFSTMYTLNYHRTSLVTSLSQLVASVGTVSPTLSLNVSTYYQTLLSQTDQIAYTATSTSQWASISFTFWDGDVPPSSLVYAPLSQDSTGAISLASGNNTVQLRVSAEDPASQRIYNLIIHRLSPDDALGAANITDIFSESSEFDRSVRVYTYFFISTITDIMVKFTTSNQYATVQYALPNSAPVVIQSGVYAGPLPLPIGDTLLTVTVIAENGLHQTDYLFTLHRISLDVSLRSLVADNLADHLSPPFDPAVLSYVLVTPESLQRMSFLPTANSSTLLSLTYIISYDVTQTPVALFGATVPSLIYTLLPLQPTSFFGLVVGDSLLTLRLIAEDTTTAAYYRVRVHRMSAACTLTSLTINPSSGGLVPFFAASNTAYSLTVPWATAAVQATSTFVYPLMAVTNYSVVALGAQTSNGTLVSSAPTMNLPMAVGDNMCVFTITSEDTLHTTVYTVVIHRISRDPTMAAVSFSHSMLGIWPAFSSMQTDYIVSFPYSVSTVALTVDFNWLLSSAQLNRSYSPSDPNGVQILRGVTPIYHAVQTVNYPLTVGNNSWLLICTAEDLTTTITYQFNINRVSIDPSIKRVEVGGYNTASTFIVNGTDIMNPDFAASVTSYTMMLPNLVSGITLSAVTTWPRANWAYAQSSTSVVVAYPSPGQFIRYAGISSILELKPGANTFFIISTAQDGVNTQQYSFDIFRESDWLTMSLRGFPNAAKVIPAVGFFPGVAIDSAVLPFSFENVDINATMLTLGSVSAWSDAQPTPVTLSGSQWTGRWSLNAGSTTTISVYSSVDAWTYAIAITRLNPDLSAVTFVNTDGPALVLTPSSFVPSIRAYSYSCPYITIGVTVSAAFVTLGTVFLQNVGVEAGKHALVSMSGYYVPLSQGTNLLTITSTLDGGMCQKIQETLFSSFFP